MEGRLRTNIYADQSNHQQQNNHQQQQQQQNNHTLFPEASSNNVEFERERRHLLRLRAEAEEKLQRLKKIEQRYLQNLPDYYKGCDLELVLRYLSLDAEPQRCSAINTAATPQTRPNYFYFHHPDHGHMNSPSSSNYSNGIAPSSSRLGELSSSSPILNNGGYDLNARYHDHEAVIHQYNDNQRFSSFSSMNEVRGKVVMTAKNQQGSRFLQEKLRQRNPLNVDMIFSEVKRSLCPLMTHQFGHHVVDMLIDVADTWKLDEIIVFLTSDLRGLCQVCTDFHGTKVMQKLVGRLCTPEQQYLLASAMSLIVLPLTNNHSSGAVIGQCLQKFYPNYKKLLLSAVAEHCVDIAQDKSGCCTLQKCFEQADEESFSHLVAPMIQNSVALSQHRYANYAVQYVLQMRKLEVNRKMAARFEGKFVSVSMNKHGSHVLETLVKNSGLEKAADIVLSEIMNSSDPLLVSEDPFGNFVVQAVIEVIKDGPLFDSFKDRIQKNRDRVRRLQSHMYGKNVLEKLNGRLKPKDERSNSQNNSNVEFS